ncbi:MAG: hypothetical protein PHU12_02395 [Candidatus Aenigmarchaeota archaeon]|nr:hypothetical protein [Candidatus Aenigmarchaeota archaeon]
MTNTLETLRGRLKGYTIRFKKERDRVRNEEKCNKLVDDFNLIKDDLKNEENFEFIDQLGDIQTLGGFFGEPATLGNIKNVLNEIENQLEQFLNGFDLSCDDLQNPNKEIEHKKTEIQPQIQLNISQNNKQIMTIKQISNLNLEQLNEYIQELEMISDKEKEIAENNIRCLEKEINERRPNKTKLKEIGEWAINFSKKYGVDILIPIISKILNFL